MANSLVNDGIGMTPVRSKIAAAQIADRLRRQLPINEEDVGVLRRLYRQRRAELLAAAANFVGCS